MMINRRRAYGGKKEDTYIQDGLVFWLDGINKGNNPLAWTDLVGGLAFPYNNGQEIRSDSVYFNGNSGLTCAANSPRFPLASCQVEVVIDNSQNARIIVIPSNLIYTNIAFGFANGGYIVGCVGSGARSRFTGTFPAGKVSYSLNNNGCFYNNVTLYNVGQSYWSENGDVFNVGCRDNDYKYTGNIFSIRIYNRQLTNAERIHNNNIDKQRFNIQ